MYGTYRKNSFSPQIQYFSYTKKCWGFCGEGGRRAGQRERKNLTSVRYLKELKRGSIHICYFFPAQQWLSHTSLDKQAKCQLINECVEWSKKDA